MRCRSLLQRRIFVNANLQPISDLCKFYAKNIATIFHKQKPSTLQVLGLKLKSQERDLSVYS